MFYVFRDTEFDIKDKSIVGYWIENSYLPFIYNGRAMDMVRGREISRYYEQTDFAYMKIISAILILCELDEFAYIRGRIKALITKGFFELSSAFAAELASSLLKDRSVQREESAPYFRSFNTMDRAVKYGKDYAVSLSMHSERIAAFESINNENQNAYHTSDGMMHIYKENEPRSDIFWPTIDLERLSGTTTVKNSHEKPNVNASGDFTGGCGINEYGVCAMKMVSEENSLRANKAWFFFDNDIVCLGSNINCRDGQNVETVIENRLVTDNSRFTIHGIEDGKGYLISGVYLNGIYDIGYYFPEEQKVSVVREVRKGAWSNISSKTDGRIYEDMYVTMWIDHGKDPKNESYAYIVIPKCDEGEIEDYYNKSGINIIENSDSIQCVKKNNVTAAVFLKDRRYRRNKL